MRGSKKMPGGATARQSTAPGVLSGGRLRFGRWVPAVTHCRRNSRPPNATVQPLPTGAHRMLRPYNFTLDHAAEQAAQLRTIKLTHAEAVRACDASAHRPPFTALAAPSSRAATWRCEESDLGAAGVRYLVGVHTTPGNRARRDAIRRAWTRHPLANATLVCFVIGTGGLPAEMRRALAEESATFGDLAALREVSEGACHLTIEKAHAWWVWAAARRVAYTARVDDDTYLHLPNLEAALRPLHCHASLVFGLSAFVGYKCAARPHARMHARMHAHASRRHPSSPHAHLPSFAGPRGVACVPVRPRVQPAHVYEMRLLVARRRRVATLRLRLARRARARPLPTRTAAGALARPHVTLRDVTS